MRIKEVWNRSPKRKRAELARTLGYRGEWAKLNFEELGKRGGGMLQRDLQKLYKIIQAKRRRKR